MAEWKKLIVSGSDAELRHLKLSEGTTVTSASIDLASPLKFDTVSGSISLTPLVIDSNGNVFTGSAYAQLAGGNTVGGSSLEKNIAIIGAGGSLIQTASSHTSGAVDFNNAQLSNMSAISASGNLLFSGSTGNTVFEIKTTGSTLHITASGINAGNVTTNKLNITSLSTTGRIPIVGAGSEIVDDADLSFSTATDTLTVKKIDNIDAVKHITSSGNITASGYIVGKTITASNSYHIGSNRLAYSSSANLHIGANVNTVISASSLMLSASGGITASVIPIDSPTHYLGQKASGEIVRVDVSTIGSGDGSSIVGVSEGTNIDITGGSSTTEYIKIFDRIFSDTAGVPYGWESGGTVISGSDTTPNGGEGVKTSFFTSDIATTLQTGTAVVKLVHENGSNATQIVTVTSFDEEPGTNSTKWQLNLADPISFANDQKHISVHLQVTTITGNPVISLEDNISIAGSSSFAGDITASGNLLFSASAGTTASIGYIDGINLDISASNAVFTGNVDASSYSVNAIQVIAHETLVLSGSTTFGSSSLSTHTFTGSLLISGSEINLVNGQFTGRGTGLTHITASTLAGTNGATALVGTGVVSGSAQIDGASITTNTISGITLGGNLNDLTVDDTTLKLDSGTTYNGSAGKTISAKTATVTDSGTALATGDQIYDHVTDRINGLTSNDGTVTSVATADGGGVSGITLSGGPITTTGTITLGGTLLVDLANDVGSSILPIANGGTNASTAAGAASNLGLGTEDSPTFTGLTLSGNSLSIDGTSLTATVTELNVLDGIPAGLTSTEIGYLDGVTSAIQTQLNNLANPSNATTFSDNVTINGTLGVDGNVTLGNESSDTVTIAGDLIVNGNTTTLSSTELQIEDRFILIGSGSSTDNATNLGGNVDVGIIFESRQGTNGNALGTALYHDASDDRLNVARGVPTNIGANQVGTSTYGIQTGHVVTVRTTSSLGTQLNTTTNKSAIEGDGDVIFGAGEMVIDSNKDIWIYTA